MLEIDILNRIKQDFDEDNVSIVEDYLSNKLETKSDRIQRCVLQLSQGSLEKLQHNIECANTDYRDVIWWAEYDDSNNQIHDFNKPFSN